MIIGSRRSFCIWHRKFRCRPSCATSANISALQPLGFHGSFNCRPIWVRQRKPSDAGNEDHAHSPRRKARRYRARRERGWRKPTPKNLWCGAGNAVARWSTCLRRAMEGLPPRNWPSRKPFSRRQSASTATACGRSTRSSNCRRNWAYSRSGATRRAMKSGSPRPPWPPSGPVLIAWEHENIPAIVNAIVGNKTTCPQKWPKFAVRFGVGAGSSGPKMLAGSSDRCRRCCFRRQRRDDRPSPKVIFGEAGVSRHLSSTEPCMACPTLRYEACNRRSTTGNAHV